MLIEYDAVDHLLLGLLTSNKTKILEMEDEDEITTFFKEELMDGCLSNDGVGSFMLADSLFQFLQDFDNN